MGAGWPYSVVDRGVIKMADELPETAPARARVNGISRSARPKFLVCAIPTHA